MAEESRPLTSSEVEELQGYLVSNASKLIHSPKISDDSLIRNIGNLITVWYGKRKIRPPAIRVILNPDREIWVDVEHMFRIN